MCEAHAHHAHHSKGADAVQQWQKLMSELRPMSDAARMQPGSAGGLDARVATLLLPGGFTVRLARTVM